MDTTYVNRANTNEEVIKRANSLKNPDQIEGKDIIQFKTYVQNKQAALLKHTVRAPDSDPHKQCCFLEGTNLPMAYPKRRVGRPRHHWAMQSYRYLALKHNVCTEAEFKQNPVVQINKIIPMIQNRVI